jgi:hypothetical protein
VTCYGDKVKNANCPKDQYMVVKFATYRGLLAPKKCGLSDDYSCEVDVTCLVKKQCDGLHECNITVDDNLFSGDLCAGLSNYLYFEYQCVDTVKPFKELCGMHGYKYGSIDGYNLQFQSTFLKSCAQYRFLWCLKMFNLDLARTCRMHVTHISEISIICLHRQITNIFVLFVLL